MVITQLSSGYDSCLSISVIAITRTPYLPVRPRPSLHTPLRYSWALPGAMLRGNLILAGHSPYLYSANSRLITPILYPLLREWGDCTARTDNGLWILLRYPQRCYLYSIVQKNVDKNKKCNTILLTIKEV